MRVVKRSRVTMTSVKLITCSALLGSKAAVCSSSSSSRGFSHVAIKRVRAWRCPPERLPIALSSRSSRPKFNCRTRVRSSSLVFLSSAQPSPRGSPRLAARTRFSAIVRLGEVPVKGFWNTRPIRPARRCSGQRVMSMPSTEMVPASRRKVPATALSRVDFPEPLVPIMTTKAPSSSVTSTPSIARTSLGVPGLKTFVTLRISSISCASLPRPELMYQVRQNQCHEDEYRCNQFEVVWIQSQAQGDSHQQAEEHRSHYRAAYGQAQLTRPHQRLSDDDTRKSPDHHADAHLHIGEALVLRQ